MTKKDFELIASVISNNRRTKKHAGHLAVTQKQMDAIMDSVRDDFLNVFVRTEPRFNPTLFDNACK